jgi:hypothetical protein
VGLAGASVFVSTIGLGCLVVEAISTSSVAATERYLISLK